MYFMSYSPYAKWKVKTTLTLRKMSEELRSTSDSLFSFFLGEQLRFLQGLFCKCLPLLKLFLLSLASENRT